MLTVELSSPESLSLHKGARHQSAVVLAKVLPVHAWGMLLRRQSVLNYMSAGNAEQ